MSTRQREVGRAMIECRRTPRARRVTHRAVMRKIERLMVRVRRTVEVGSMTSITRRRQSMVHIVDVTLRAGHCLMRARERETCRAVAECGGSPHRCGMAWTAIVTEVTRNVIRIRRLSKLHLMALIAVVKHQLIVAVDVA